jgi:hypothetical protein
MASAKTRAADPAMTDFMTDSLIEAHREPGSRMRGRRNGNVQSSQHLFSWA